MERALKVDYSLINVSDKDTPVVLEVAAEILKSQFYSDLFEEAEGTLEHINH